MKTFNITSQVYNNKDNSKQTLLMNDIIMADNPDNAIAKYKQIYSDMNYEIVRIYSIEEIPQVAA